MIALLRTLRELAQLRLPVTAAAVLATVLALVAPFGVEIGDETTAQVTGALVGLGVAVEWLRQLLEDRHEVYAVPREPQLSSDELLDARQNAEPGSSPAVPGS